MRIERIDTFPLLYQLLSPYGDANGYKKYRSCFLIRITTQSGIVGWGECADWLPTLQKGFAGRIIPYLTGRSAFNRLELVHTIQQWHQRAAAGVSMALTEISAKFSGMHICELWGGRWRNELPVYASFQSYSELPDWKERSLSIIEQSAREGFSQLKIKIGGRSLQDDQRHVSDVQYELGDRVRIVLDANQSYDTSTMRRWSKLLEQWDNIAWIEEPIPFHLADEYALLRTMLPAPLAGGENLTDANAFLPLLKNRALDIIQPDPAHHSGIDAYRESLGLARQFGFRVSPHCYDGGLARMYAIFAQACLPPWSKMGHDMIEPVEWDVMENPFIHMVQMKPVKGSVRLPEGIGTGLEPDMELIKAHLWDGKSYAD